MANGGPLKPAGRTFFPTASQFLAHDTSCPKKCAPPVLLFVAPLMGSSAHRPPWPVPRQQGDRPPATDNKET